jgi:hypothetical protein
MNEQHQYIEGFLPKEESVARIAQSSLYQNGTVYPIPRKDLCGRFSSPNANSGFLGETLAHPLDEIIGSIEVRLAESRQHTFKIEQPTQVSFGQDSQGSRYS